LGRKLSGPHYTSGRCREEKYSAPSWIRTQKPRPSGS
jgi:hypothetical protein